MEVDDETEVDETGDELNVDDLDLEQLEELPKTDEDED